jgi:putative sterol carrier protein
MLPRLSRRSKGSLPEGARSLKLKIHLDITGARGQDFVLDFDEGVLDVRTGIARPPDASLCLSDETFLDLLTGKTDAATAAMIGRIAVRGEPTSLMVLRGIVEAFRQATENTGARGKIARGIETLMARRKAGS